MAAKIRKLSDQIRDAVNSSGLSRYRISKDLGIAESTLSRFMAGSGMEMENLDALAAFLELRLQGPQDRATAQKGKVK